MVLKFNILFTEILFSLGFLLVFGHTSYAVDPNCFFQMDVLPDRMYYIASPNYPNNYAGANSCRWNIRSASRLHVNCEVFEVPSVRYFKKRVFSDTLKSPSSTV